MPDPVHELMAGALRGKKAHVDPVRALSDLSAESAASPPAVGVHSAHEVLAHMVYWQDLLLQAARGEHVTWPQKAAEGWEDRPREVRLSTWGPLVARFQAGLAEAEHLARTADLERPLANWEGASVLSALSILASHNSYHLGQIVMARQLAGHWPPPGGGDTW